MRKTKVKIGGKTSLPFGMTIRMQLVIGFLIPIICIIVIGFVSYQKAYDGLTGNYKKSSITAMEMTIRSLDTSMQTISSVTMELAQDKTVNAYALGGYKSDVAKRKQAETTIRNNMNVKETSSKMIAGIHIIPVDGMNVITTQRLGTSELASFMNEMSASDDAWMLSDSLLHWGSGHAFVDETLEMDNSGYIMHCSESFASGNMRGVVIVDVSYKAVQELLQELDFGSGSSVSFITEDGRVISSGEDVDMEQLEGAESGNYVEVNGNLYFYMSAKSSVTGGRIVSLVPKSYITKESNNIKNISVIMVLAACVTAILVGTVITAGITGNIQKSVGGLNQVSKGELRIQPDGIHNERNEFGRLHKALSNTVSKIRGLILTVAKMKDAVLRSGEKVMETSSELNAMVENVSSQMEEINDIVERQNSEIANCNERMEQLSGQIKIVSSSVQDTISEVEGQRTQIDDGMRTVQEMMQQSMDTADATEEVEEHVTKLGVKLEQIANFVSNIQNIASQTNLLSLNASIEAARAGEYGRGFSVVAQEIRNLADDSGETAEEIQKVIEEVTVYSKNAVKKAEMAGNYSKTQLESAQLTIDAFQKMGYVMERLLQNMQRISKEVEAMNLSRYEVLHEVRAIGESSEHTVKSTGEVNRFLERQIEAAGILKAETVKMQENMSQLEEAIASFQMD